MEKKRQDRLRAKELAAELKEMNEKYEEMSALLAYDDDGSAMVISQVNMERLPALNKG